MGFNLTHSSLGNQDEARKGNISLTHMAQKKVMSELLCREVSIRLCRHESWWAHNRLWEGPKLSYRRNPWRNILILGIHFHHMRSPRTVLSWKHIDILCDFNYKGTFQVYCIFNLLCFFKLQKSYTTYSWMYKEKVALRASVAGPVLQIEALLTVSHSFSPNLIHTNTLPPNHLQ